MQDIQNQRILHRTEVLIDKLLAGRLSLAEVTKVICISEQVIQNYLNARPILEHQELLSQS